MDINDPRRRLQVLNQSSPSLRVATAPTQQLKVTTAPSQRLFVGNQQINREPAANTAPYEPPKKKNFVSQVAEVVTKPFEPVAEAITRTLPGGNADLIANQKLTEQNNANAKLFNDLYRQGKISSVNYRKAMENVATDSQAQSEQSKQVQEKADISKGVASAVYAGATPLGAAGFGAKTLVGRIASEAGIGGGFGVLNQGATNADPTLKGAAKEAGIGALIGGLIPGATSLIGKGVGLFKNRGADKVLNQLVNSNNADEITQILSKNVPDAEEPLVRAAADFVAKENNPQTIQAVIDDLTQGGPNLADGVYTAYQPHPDSIPEGYHVPGSPDPSIKLTSPEELAAQRATNEESLRFSEAGQNAKEVAKDPTVAKVVQGGTQDPLAVVINTVTKTEDPKAVRGLIDKLMPSLSPGQRKRLAEKLTKTDNEDEATALLAEASTKSPDIRAEQTALEQATQPVEQPQPVTQAAQAEQAIEQLPPQNGTIDAPVASEAPTTATTPEAVSNPVNQNADQAVEAPTDAKAAFPDADPEAQKAIQEVMDSLNDAQKAYNKNSKVVSQEKAARINKGEASYETAGGGEAGFRAKAGSLAGEYSKSGYNPITVPENVQKTILDDIEKSSLRGFEKLNVQNAMRKVWGANEKKPTKSDIIYIRKYFGDDLADTVKDVVESGGKDWRDLLRDVAGIPRAAMASFDLSMGGRQGAPFAARHFDAWKNANIESVKYGKSTEYFQEEMSKIANDDAYELITGPLGIRLPSVANESDEVMASANMLSKIPVYGKGIDFSDRAYSGGLTKLRYNVAKKVIDGFGGIDDFRAKFSDQELKDIGEVINTFTGSGGKPGGITERHMQTLATTLFAPRLWAANLNRLNPVFYARLTPEARKMALQAQSSFFTVAGAVLGMAAMAGASVSWDPRSADFAKIKVGNTRYDILGGQQQNIRFLAQQITGEKINSSTGELQTVGEGFGKPSRFDLAVDFAGNKLNPLLGYAKRLAESRSDGTNKFGEPVNPFQEFSNLLTPLNIQSIISTAKDTGSAPKSVAMNIPGFVGFGAQTYGDTPTKDQGKVKEDGTKEFKGKVTPEMVTDENGKPYTDEKGRPVKVKFPEGATDLEKQALIEDARGRARSDSYTRNLSGEDQALIKLDDKQLRKYVKEGKMDQEKFDAIKQLQENKDNLGGPDIPKEVTSKYAKDYYAKFNSIPKDKQDAWLRGNPEPFTKDIAAKLNKERPRGLDEFKPSNELAKAYAEFEKDLLSHPDYTDIDKNNKVKAFQAHAYKLNYSNQVRDIFAEGGSADLKKFITDKQISKDDLDAAIKLDNDLYNSGVTGSLKFSKKFRNEYGFAVPSGGGAAGGGSGGSGGGKTAKTQKAYLNDLLPSFAKGPEKPTFSAIPRGKSKITSSGPKGSSKKVSIRL